MIRMEEILNDVVNRATDKSKEWKETMNVVEN
jgi:hypothetical protein